VFLKDPLIKGIICFGTKGKLILRYIGPYVIIARVSTLAYRLQLSKSMSGVHPVFHVSIIEKILERP
jgi:hypothetical protein